MALAPIPPRGMWHLVIPLQCTHFCNITQPFLTSTTGEDFLPDTMEIPGIVQLAAKSTDAQAGAGSAAGANGIRSEEHRAQGSEFVSCIRQRSQHLRYFGNVLPWNSIPVGLTLDRYPADWRFVAWRHVPDGILSIDRIEKTAKSKIYKINVMPTLPVGQCERSRNAKKYRSTGIWKQKYQGIPRKA